MYLVGIEILGVSSSASVFISLIKKAMSFTCRLKSLIVVKCGLFILFPPYFSFQGFFLGYHSSVSK